MNYVDLHKPKNRSGFTLIELLVVIAVLSVLIAILLPALNMARSLGKRMRCKGNLKGIGLAWHLYLDDNNQCFPRYLNVQTCYGGWPGQIGKDDGDWAPEWRNRPLNPYAVSGGKTELTKRQAEVFSCPADRGLPDSPRKDLTTFEYLGNSFFANTFLIGQDRFPDGNPDITELIQAVNARIQGKNTTTDMVTNPHSLVVLAGDGGWLSQPWESETYPAGKTVRSSWHDRPGYYNVVFLDNRVEFVNIKVGRFSENGEYHVNPFKDLNNCVP